MFRRSLHHSATEAAAGHHDVHVTPMKYYWGVFGALIFLTVLTVAVSELHLPMPYSIIAAMAVAVVKATLVASIFMHLAWDKKLNTVVFVASLVFMLVFFTLTMVDMLSRSLVNPETGGKYKFEETLRNGQNPPGWKVADPNAAAHGEHAAEGHEADAAEGGHGE